MANVYVDWYGDIVDSQTLFLNVVDVNNCFTKMAGLGWRERMMRCE